MIGPNFQYIIYYTCNFTTPAPRGRLIRYSSVCFTYNERIMRPYNVWGGVVYHGTMGKQSEAATFTVKGDWVVYKPLYFAWGL